MQVELLEGDITTMAVDAMVNAANSSLLGGGGVDGAIHATGGPDILAACRELRAGPLRHGLPAGDAVATTAGRLPARWLIHTVGPVWRADEDRSEVLRRCYISALRVADDLGAATIAYPLISAGIFGWPAQDAVRQALTALRGATCRVREARLVLFGKVSYELAKQVAQDLGGATRWPAGASLEPAPRRPASRRGHLGEGR
jgi:O-acetyl-ADP-ribose deacetylase (regulator of RNase III)